MHVEDQRFLHEDIERLEEAITTRSFAPPTSLKDARVTDHEIADYLDRIYTQSLRLQALYNDAQEARAAEFQKIGTGDPLETFMKEYQSIKDYHKRYPGAPVENLEKAYERKPPGDGTGVIDRVRNMFTGEEGLGKYLDLTSHHEVYLNLHPVRDKLHPTYLQYVDSFERFEEYPHRRSEKLSDEYFTYITNLADYLESFFKKIKPLENHEKLAQTWDREFADDWSKERVPGWTKDTIETNGDTEMTDAAPTTNDTGAGIYCPDCEKDFKNENIYNAHLTGKKHLKNAKAREAGPQTNGLTNGTKAPAPHVSTKDKERAVASRENRIRHLAFALSSERNATKTNIERRAGMTERERQQEIEAVMADDAPIPGEFGGRDAGNDSDDDHIYNPLKLPLSWDGKPIPFWLYKLHGLGVEYACEICGGFVYQGRRAYEKHFGEPRHTYGLKCLGIGNNSLFREITSIEEAVRLSEKQAKEKKQEKKELRNVEEMEDSSGHVMPKTVYEDLRKQGII